MFLTDFGKSAYLNIALLDDREISKVGIVFSVYVPLTRPLMVKSPSVFTEFKFPAYCAGTKANRFLKDEVGVLKLISYNCPSSTN